MVAVKWDVKNFSVACQWYYLLMIIATVTFSIAMYWLNGYALFSVHVTQNAPCWLEAPMPQRWRWSHNKDILHTKTFSLMCKCVRNCVSVCVCVRVYILAIATKRNATVPTATMILPYGTYENILKAKSMSSNALRYSREHAIIWYKRNQTKQNNET